MPATIREKRKIPSRFRPSVAKLAGSTATNILDVGCGRRKVPGAIGLDRVPLPSVDVVHDFNQMPYPFEENSFDTIYLTHAIEHSESVLAVMEEVYRLAKPGATVFVITPHYTDAISWQDPTHRWHLNSYSFRYFEPEYQSSYYTHARFRVLERHVELATLWKWTGLQFLINLDDNYRQFRFIRKFWEQYLCYMMRGKQMTFRLEAIKS